ncbi:hypothetical protein [Kribbella sp. NPDC051770]|uniref:hypothetical protein n=1 Tax=Kribbella sp. NPDC051770 TaxID=3155413 RepID=UPI0034160B15
MLFSDEFFSPSASLNVSALNHSAPSSTAWRARAAIIADCPPRRWYVGSTDAPTNEATPLLITSVEAPAIWSPSQTAYADAPGRSTSPSAIGARSSAGIPIPRKNAVAHSAA